MRRHDRRPAELAVSVSAEGREPAAGSITLDSADVSEGGAFLRSDVLFEVGETLALEIPLPDGPVVKATGRVAWVADSGSEAPGMGLEFVALSDDDRRALSLGMGRLLVPPARARS